MAAFAYMNKRVVETLDQYEQGGLRDRVMIWIQTQFAFRDKTAAGLNVGHVVKEGGQLVVQVPRTLFKNKNSKKVFMKNGQMGRFQKAYQRRI